MASIFAISFSMPDIAAIRASRLFSGLSLRFGRTSLRLIRPLKKLTRLSLAGVEFTALIRPVFSHSELSRWLIAAAVRHITWRRFSSWLFVTRLGFSSRSRIWVFATTRFLRTRAVVITPLKKVTRPIIPAGIKPAVDIWARFFSLQFERILTAGASRLAVARSISLVRAGSWIIERKIRIISFSITPFKKVTTSVVTTGVKPTIDVGARFFGL